MNWIKDAQSYKYLKRFYLQIEPNNEEQFVFKNSLEWALKTLEEQEHVLSNIETAKNSDFFIPAPPKTHLVLIQGGKVDDNI